MADPKEAQESYNQAANVSGGGRHLDSELLEKNHARAYNPIDDAKRGTVAQELNDVAGKMRYKPNNKV
jgi:hypothetical protein